MFQYQKDFNVSFFKKTISNPISKAGRGVSGLYSDTTDGVGKFFKKTRRGATGLYDDTTGGVGNFFVRLWRSSGNLGIGILNTIPKVYNTVSTFISGALVDTFSSFYTSEVERTKTNKLIKVFGIVVFVCAIGITFFTLKENFDENNATQLVQVEKDKPKKVEKQKEVKKQPEKKPQKKIEEKQVKKPETKKEKSPSQVTELVLPNLNIKTETVLSLFEDVEYDLKTVRYQKRVKPIYFTQFPKDLDEIKDTKLKKETFIKIVLPLVVAENDKILDDKIKLKKELPLKKMTTDKEKILVKIKVKRI